MWYVRSVLSSPATNRMSPPSSLASVNLKLPSCRRIKIAVVPMLSAMGAPAVVVSMSIFFLIVHSLFHQEAWELFAQNKNKMPASNNVDLTRLVFMFWVLVLELRSQPRGETSGANRARRFGID